MVKSMRIRSRRKPSIPDVFDRIEIAGSFLDIEAREREAIRQKEMEPITAKNAVESILLRIPADVRNLIFEKLVETPNNRVIIGLKPIITMDPCGSTGRHELCFDQDPDRIYRWEFESDGKHRGYEVFDDQVTSWSPKHKVHLTFIYTCKQIYNEYSSIVWGENFLRIGPGYMFDKALDDKTHVAYEVDDELRVIRNWAKAPSPRTTRLFRTGIANHIVNFELFVNLFSKGHNDTHLAFLNAAMRSIRTWPELKRLRLKVGAVFDDELVNAQRIISPMPAYIPPSADDDEWYEDEEYELCKILKASYSQSISILRDAGGKIGGLAHLDKEIRFTTLFGKASFRSISERRFPECLFDAVSVTADDWSPSFQMFKELAKASGIPVYLDGSVTHDRNGDEVGSIFTKVRDGGKEVDIYGRLKDSRYFEGRMIAVEYAKLANRTMEECGTWHPNGHWWDNSVDIQSLEERAYRTYGITY